MSVVFYIHNTNDSHWQALVKQCQHLEDNDDLELMKFITGLAVLLDKFNGDLVIDESRNTSKWIDSIEFDTEEDLVFFKLTFN